VLSAYSNLVKIRYVADITVVNVKQIFEPFAILHWHWGESMHARLHKAKKKVQQMSYHGPAQELQD